MAEPTWADFIAGWQLGIYRDPVLAAMLAGLVLGVLGVFVVLRRAVFVTAVVSQSAGLGVAIAFWLEIHANLHTPPSVSALAFACLGVGALAISPERLRLPRESVLGLGFVLSSAAALLVGSRITQEAHDISSILFGTAVLVSDTDLVLVSVVGALVLAALLVCHRGLVLSGFDPEGARVQGLPVRLLEVGLWLLVALEASVTTRAIGALPVFAFATLPAMSGLAVAERFGTAVVVAAVVGAAAGALGYVAAFFGEFPVGASQGAVAAGFFVVALGVAGTTRRARPA